MESKKVKVDVKSITTKFGTAKINNSGYWWITSSKEANHGRLLHRLIFEDFHKCTLLPRAVIHHRDGNKLNNRYENLELMTQEQHASLHKTDENHPQYRHDLDNEEIIKLYINQKINRKEIAKKLNTHVTTITYRLNKCGVELWDIYKIKNSTGYLRVYFDKSKNNWKYTYIENHMKKNIYAKSLSELEVKVKAKGLTWLKLND